MLSDPPPSLSMSSKQRAAAVRKLSVNSSISFCAAFACTARAAARASSLAARADSIASCLRGTSTGEPRRTSRRHRREGGLDCVSCPLLLVDVAVAVRVEHEQRGLEARRDQQVLEVLVAAVVEKLDDLRKRC